MTSPRDVGSVTGEMRIDTDRVPDDIRDGLHKAGREGDKEIEDIGKRHGELYGKNFNAKNKDFLNRLSNDLNVTLADIRSEFADIDLDIDTRRARRNGALWFHSFFDTVQGLFRGRSGAFTDLFQNLIGGPIGAFFNVSGRSPVVLLLVPLLGIIVALITAAVYGLQAFVSLLYLIPSLLFGIGLQAAALFLIFGGLGDTITAALSAQNAEELEAALAGVSSHVARFIRQLIPWRDFLKELRGVAQDSFFGNLGDGITRVLENIRGPFTTAIANVSRSLAGVANNVLDVFASPAFAKLIEVLGKSTSQWLDGFGPALANFIDGLNQFAVAIDPFLDWFGTQFNAMISSWGDSLKELGEDPEFLQWVEDAKVIMSDFIGLLGDVWDFIKTFIAQFIAADKELTERHGVGFLDVLGELIRFFTSILASELGQEAIKGFITLLLLLSAAFFAVATVVLILLAAFQKLWEGLEVIWQAIFGQFDPQVIGKIPQALGDWGNEIVTIMINSAKAAVNGFLSFLSISKEEIGSVLTSIKIGIEGFFTNAGDWLINAGKMIINGLINGIRQAIPGLSFVLDTAAGLISSYFPSSPAERGPLSGHGDPRFAGQEIINRIAAGIKMETPALASATNNAANNITFGNGSVQVIYNGGTPPTPQQSRAMGMSAGRGITNAITATRLAVRTL